MSTVKENKVSKKSKPVAKKVVRVEQPTEKPIKIDVVGEKPKVEAKKPTEKTIFDKYRKHINTVKDGYLRDIDYPSAMEMLRYIESKTGHKLGLSMSCASCMVSLVGMFSRLEGK